MSVVLALVVLCGVLMMRTSSRRFAVHPLVLSLFALPVLAQGTAPSAAHETMVVTASKTRHSELTAPASVSVVTRAELDKLNVNDLTGALKQLPGVNISPATSYGRSEIKLRGLEGDYTLLLVNGRRISSRDALTSGYGNDFDLSAIPMAAIERIEVIRGPISSLYGADALGGVVNVILRQPGEKTEAAPTYTFSDPTDGHGGDINKASAYVGGALIDNKLLANLVVEGNHRDAWQSEQSINPKADAIEQREKLGILSNVKWLIDDRQDLDVGMNYAKDDREAHWNNYGQTPRNIQQMERLGLNATHVGRWEQFDSRVGYAFEQVDLFDDSELMTALSKTSGDVSQTNHTFDGQLSGNLGNHLLTSGAEYRITELKHNVNLKGGDVSVNQSALYLQDEFGFGDLALTLSGRVDHHETYGTEFSPRGYALYSLTDNWVVKGGIGKAFKAPTIAQSNPDYAVAACRGRCAVVGNPDLKPETAVSYELGTAYDGSFWGAGITAFHNDIKDKIQSEAWTSTWRPAVMTYQNVSKARIKGVELSGWFDITDALTLSSNVTLIDGEDKTSGKDLYRTPEHTANAKLEWQVIESLSTQLGWNYTGSQILPVPRMSGTTYETTAGFHTLDVGAVWNATRALDLKFGLNNLTNTKRDWVATEADQILDGRTVYAGVAYKL